MEGKHQRRRPLAVRVARKVAFFLFIVAGFAVMMLLALLSLAIVAYLFLKIGT